MSEPLWQPRSDLSARLLGAGFFLIGAVLLTMQSRSILSAIKSSAPVTYSHAAIAMGEFALLIGAYWMVRGLAGYRSIRALPQNRAAFRWFGFFSALLFGTTLLALHFALQSLGYDS